MTDNKMTNPTKEVFKEDRVGDVEFTTGPVTEDPSDAYKLVPDSQLEEVIDEGPNHKVIVTADPHYGLYVFKYTLGKVPEVLRGKFTSRTEARKAYLRHKNKIEQNQKK